MNYFLGLEVHQSEVGIFLNQEKYAYEILKKFRMKSCKFVPTPSVQNLKLSKDDGAEKMGDSLYRNVIGSLLYLTSSRPDLTYAASLLSTFMKSLSVLHFVVAKRALKYLKLNLESSLNPMKMEVCLVMLTMIRLETLMT